MSYLIQLALKSLERANGRCVNMVIPSEDTWRKVHVGICADSGQVIVSAITSNNIGDDTAMLHMLDGVSLGNVLGDGAYDTIDCRGAIHDRNGKQIIPPKRTACVQRKNPIPCLLPRDRAIRARRGGAGSMEKRDWLPPQVPCRNIHVSLQDHCRRSSFCKKVTNPGRRS